MSFMAAAPLRILHVEDVPADAELAERELRRAGFELDIRRVETREAFLAALLDFSPDLILSDYRLPEFDGMTALLLAKERAPDVPVIITTGSVNEETAVACMKAGAVDYVLKEQLGRLGTAVRSALEAQRLRDERSQAEKDITRLNAELEEALAWQRHVFEGSRDAVFVSDEEARFVAVNGAATELTGYSREELLGMGIPDLHEEPDLAAYRAFHQRILGGEQILSEAPIRKKDGSKVAVEFNNRLVTIGVRRFMHTAGRDVTKRKQLEAQLVQAQKMEAVGRLAGGVAHDFNNLLTVIQGYGELLAKSLEGDPEKRESMGEIVKAAERAAALTRQLLAFSRRQVLEMRVLDLGTVVADLEKMLRRLIGEDVEVVVVTPPKLGRVKADAGQIEQVVLNLAVNARDAMPGGGRLTLELADADLDAPFAAAHDTIPPGRYVLLSIADTGSGMDAETLGHIFEPFFTTKEKGKGTGLGLATVYGIVRQTGGYIAVETVPGAGTAFRIYLPRCAESRTSGTRPSVSSFRGSETVLLAEDEPSVRAFLQTVLERHGYSVLVAENGAAALDVVTRDPRLIHVLLTDLVMPGMNGRELASRVAALRPAIRIVFMSGYAADIVTDLAADGASGFLSKPFSERALAAKLREVLDAPPA
ncbi:MAG: response regulator [Thermoanaerobaculia bacterium]|nr:response regulator [Thermoanaerobaculia bacterium]